MAQGIANVVAPFFGGIPATGAIARTATNVRTGARSPVAGIVHAITLLVVVLVAAPLARYVPLPAPSAVLIVVALNMGDWKAFVELRCYSVPYRIVLLTTFAITVAFDLSTAVEIGLMLASLFFIYRISNLTRIDRLENDDSDIAAFSVFGALSSDPSPSSSYCSTAGRSRSVSSCSRCIRLSASTIPYSKPSMHC